MRWREVLKAPVPACPAGQKKRIRAQVAGNYLILDLWQDGIYKCRHATDIQTGEPGTYYPDSDSKTGANLNSAADERGWYWGQQIKEEEWNLSKEDEELIKSVMSKTYRGGEAFRRITVAEENYNRDRRERAIDNKQRRLNELMSHCPPPGQVVQDWVVAQAVGDLQYAFYDKIKKTCHCTACNRDFDETAPGGQKIKQKDTIKCPLCGSSLVVEKRKGMIVAKTRLYIIHDIDDKRGVMRHFEVEIAWQDTRKVYFDELIRLMMQRNMKYSCKIYYDNGWGDWSEGNRMNRRWKPGYLYPDSAAIRAGLDKTAHQIWQDVFPQLAAAGIKGNYNGLLCESNHYWTGIAEYLAKGRFYKLLEEESDTITPWGGYYGITLDALGESVAAVLRIQDKQLINRLRQENGGRLMLKWLQWSDEQGEKISAECMTWLQKVNLCPDDYGKSTAAKYLNLHKLMNYITRQCAESYKGKTPKTVLSQYEDYLDMAAQLGKKMDDEMVYRPRELKRRHDEAVEEANRRREELQRKRNAEAAKREAQRMREKYPGYEELLAEIKAKYEYASDTYLIRVPKDFAEITAEGMALHHCVGNTERYFDRIMSRETYICFLRQQSSPDEPFYTIEVEPGGTIRQHRGAYDEEPGIEEIKPFLREWQQVIRKRMSKEDHKYARTSAVLRQKNIDELKEKNNVRVLNGLMEDLMEVI